MSLNQYSTAGAQTMPGMGGAITASQESVPVRMAFLRKVYSLFGLSLILWAGITALIYTNDSLLATGVRLVQDLGYFGWIIMMMVPFGVLHLTAKRFPINLAGLGIFAILEGLITAPLIALFTGSTLANGTLVMNPGVGGLVLQAFFLTATIFGSLTAYVLITKKDFSFIGGGLSIALGLAFGMMVFAMLGVGGGIVAGSGFAMAMVLIFAGYTLFHTSAILRTYPANQATMAAAMLLVDFIAMFRWILILLSNRN
jgi:FtsH-binding integral membrane protein